MQNPFRYFNSSPEVIRLAVMIYIRHHTFTGGKSRRCGVAHSSSANDAVDGYSAGIAMRHIAHQYPLTVKVHR